tara:strand:+ start:372 stop:623 length:252 start_codon:yes stop_codon:yes gene_type:complete
MSKDKMPNNVIPFPNVRERVGKKYRQQEIESIVEMLRLCDEDMETIVKQIDQLQIELASLTTDYERFMDRLNKLLEIEGEQND